MKKIVCTLTMLFGMTVQSVVAATTGSYLKSAKSLSPSSSEKTLQVTLTAAYDPDEKVYDKEYGVYYVKVKVNRGNTCSIWVDGKSSEDLMFLADSDPDDEKLIAAFDSYSRTGAELFVLTKDCWDADDPKSGTFYFYVDGNVGDTCTIHYQTGAIDGDAWEEEEEPPTVGTQENPAPLTLKETETTVRGTLGSGGFYYYQFKAEANRAYRFQTVGGKANSPLSVSVDEGTAEYEDVEDSTATVDDFNAAIEIRTSTSGTIVILVDGDESAEFSLKGWRVPMRGIAQHPAQELAAGNGYSATFVPGRLSAEKDFWDVIIDENLYKIELGESQRCIFSVEGATTNLLMRVYDAKGNVLEEDGGTAEDLNPYCALKASVAGTYYVGVCQRDLEVMGTAASEAVSLSVTLVGAAVEGSPDEWDARDDEVDGATPINPVISNDGNDDPLLVDEGHGVHGLSLTDWADCFKFTCQKTVKYRVATSTTADAMRSLRGEVFTVDKGREVPVVSGILSEAGGLAFDAEKSGTYYLRVTVNEGMGLDYDDYKLHLIAYKPDVKLRGLRVDIKGPASAYWTYSNPTYKDEAKWKAGDRIVTWGTNTITFAKVSGFTTPSVVVDGEDGDSVVVGVYNDTFDPIDDAPSGKTPTGKKYAPTSLQPSVAGKSVERTLYVDDVADWFSFSSVAGGYYRFELKDVAGSPRVQVFGPNSWDEECAYVLERDPTKAVQVCAVKKGTYYVRVAHVNADSPEDSAYTLTASMATPGVVKLAKTALTVKDSAGHADISVSRTGRDGRVRVAFRTEGAQSDRADAYYYPTNGVLEWADGDNKAKTVRVRLAPDAAWHDVRTVKLVLSAIPEDDEGFDPSKEYVAAFPVDARTGATLDTATVTVTSAAKAAPGTVQLADTDTPKRPVVDVKAGEPVTLTLERTGGADGLIAVTATTVRGTANKTAGLDYDETAEETLFTWKDGETEAKTLTIRTKAVAGDHTAKKTFTVKLAAKTGRDADGTAYARPTLAAASVTVNILNEKFASTMAAFAKTLPKDGGVAVREGKAGTWFVAEDGSFFASPAPADLTFTLDGPGRFTYRAAGEATNRVAYVAAGKKTVAVKGVAGIAAYTWEPLPAATPLAPTWDKAVLRAGPATLAFAQAAGVSYRVYLLNAAERGVRLGDAATEVPAPYAVELAADAKYTWRVDSYFEGGTVTNVSKKAWALATLGADAPGTPVAGGADAWGKPVAYDSASAAATNIALRVGVRAEIAVADKTATAVKSVAGRLPTGLKVEQDRASKAWFIRGVPTKAGAFEALVQATYRDEATRKAVPGTTTAFGFDVAPLGAAAGTFNGLAATSDTTNGAPRLASIALTAAATGKLSAKVQIAGKSYTFAAAGYEVAEQEADGSVRLQAELENVAKVKVGEGREAVTVTVTNTLRCALLASATNTAAVWRDEPQVDIAFAALPDAKGAGFQEDVWYSGRIVRDGAKITDRTELAAWQAEAAAFAGYYTVSLPVAAITDAPRGSGYLTLTLDAKGKAKVAGLLADGTRYTGSATCSLAEEDGAAVARVPVFAAKATTAFGGWLTLRVGADGVPVVSASLMGDDLLWVNDEPKATREGLEGFETTLHPVGGWYDTVLNLQRAYLESDLSVSLPEGDEALEEIRELMALPEGYAFKARPDGTPVTLNGDKMEVEKQKFVTGSDRLKVWEASVNAANVKITFNRKTGLVNGSFDLWYEGVNARGVKEQKSVSGLKHNGVVLLARDPDDGTLDPDVLSSGFFLAPLKVTDTTGARPTTRTWNASYRFDINAVWSERNWQDASAGE